ncbi:MAG: MATE family efflux transporter [Bacteroidales bacterium]|nr:MATE family efflux transporter [Bacteroidales bacterium]MDY0285349.1 MATE family efflux transporter [Bacteroidales bacterium]
METKSIGRLMWQYFVPSFIGVMVNSLYNIVDRVYIGQGVGSLALAGLSVVFPIMIIGAAFGMMIGIGSGVRVSINLGKKDFSRAEQVLGNGFTLMILVSVLYTIAGYALKDPLLRWFGATGATYDFAQEYLDIILAGGLFQTVGFSLNNIIRAEGNARIAMYSMLLSAGVNIVLDPILIFGFGMGVAGAAWATLISMAALDVWVLNHFLRSRKSVIKLRLPAMRLDWRIVKYIIAIGISPFSMQVASSAVQAILNTRLITYGGDLAVSAIGIINSISMLVVMSVVSITMAAQPIIGYNYGALQFGRVKETLKLSMLSATLVSVFTWAIIMSFPDFIVKLFNTSDPELLAIGVHGLRIFLFMLPIVGFQIVAGNYFQAVGKASTSLFLTLLRQVLALIPLLLILPTFFGLEGVWGAMPLADIFSACVVTFFLTREWKQLSRKELAVMESSVIFP